MLYQLKTIGDHVGVLATAMLLLSGVAEAMRVAILETAIAKRDSPPPADPTFINTALNAVNTIRVQHDAANLTWDADLAAIALTKANGCTLNHTVGIPARRNLTNPQLTSADGTGRLRRERLLLLVQAGDAEAQLHSADAGGVRRVGGAG